MATTAIELRDQQALQDVEPLQEADQTLNEESRTSGEFSLQPADEGKDAWLFLAASFLIEALVWGFPFAFGIFQDYYSTSESFASTAGIAAIGTSALGIMYLGMPVVMIFQRLFPRLTRWGPAFGMILMCGSLAASSFSHQTSHLIITQGVLYGIGGSIAYNPCILYMQEWFVRRRSLAYGVMWAGTGLGGVAFPLLLEYLLDIYGFRTTLRIWSIALFIPVLPLLYFIKPRLPISATTHYKPYKFGFVKQPTFLVFMIPTVIESLGYFLPAIYLPAFAKSTLGAGSFASALTVLLINIASVFGVIVMGTLADRLRITTCVMISTIGAVIGVFFLWGLATSLPLLYTFCVVYGFFAGSYACAWPGVMNHVVNEAGGTASPVDPIMVFSFLAAGRGVGNVLSGPLSEALVHSRLWEGQVIGGWGSGYGALIAFTGTTAAVGGLSGLWRNRLL